MIQKEKIREIYKRYGFTEAPISERNIAVFTLRSGHFHNADIIPLVDDVDVEGVFSDFKNTGYACKIRQYRTVEDVEKQLFLGFFSADSTHARLNKEYERFTKAIVTLYASDASYEYIHTKYLINDDAGEEDILHEISSRLVKEKPVLFLIEAAAGFGKTCTAYELMRHIISNYKDKVPLFTEFSRNRQAKIFRYVLLDEIDRSFPLLSSGLVTAEIKRGNVPLILDGFDELLRSKEDDGFERVEPMLETIGELLKDRAKIILTTRRTAIFNGDEFHEWISSHQDDFDVIRIRLSEPAMSDWLSAERIKSLGQNNVPVGRLANPVLLSYLKYINDVDFGGVLNEPDKIVDRYFEVMLEREQERQNLRMTPEQQFGVIKSIAEDMMKFNYSSESKEYITKKISSTHEVLLDQIRKAYPAEERPTRDELATKLASHAFLDKASGDEQGVGFVNEFIMGIFCGEVGIDDPLGEWACDERFVEPSLIAFLARSPEKRVRLLAAMKFLLNFWDDTYKFKCHMLLAGKVDYKISMASIERLEIVEITVGSAPLSDVVFISCNFHKVKFRPSVFESVSFVNCKFFDCEIDDGHGENSVDGATVLGCWFNGADIFERTGGLIRGEVDEDEALALACESHVLETFIPVGSKTRFKHRPLKVLITKTGVFSYSNCYAAVDSLKKKKILSDAQEHGIVEIDFSKKMEIESIIGRSI